MDLLAKIQTRRKKLARQIEKMRQAFEAAGDKWQDDAERDKWDKLNKRFEQSEKKIKQLRKATQPSEGRGHPIYGTGEEIGGDKPRRKLTGIHHFRNERTGAMVRSFGPQDRMSEDNSLSIGKCLRALILNRRDDLDEAELRSILGGSDTGGGFLLSPQMSLNIVDLARAASVVIRAGAQTIPMDSSELNIARITSDPTVVWRPELVAATGSQPAFDRIWLRARTVMAIIPVSIEWLEDVANGAQVLENCLRAALSLELDRVALVGTGAASQPKGIANNADVNTVAVGGTPTNYVKYTNAVQKILTANYPGDVGGLAWILHPRDGETLDNLKDSTNQPMQPTPWCNSLKRLYTTSLPITGGAGSDGTSIIGDFSQVVIGMRTSGVNVRILDAGTVVDSAGATFNAASQLGKLVVAYLRCDVGILRPTWLTALTGITNT